MGSMPRSKDRSRGELEKLREMSPKEKIGYIFSYYGHLIIGGIIAVAVSVSLLTTCLNKPDIGLNIELVALYATQDEVDAFTGALGSRLFPDGEKTIRGTISSAAEDDRFAMFQDEKRFAMLAAGVIDIFITDERTLTEYSAFGFVQPLDDALQMIKEHDPAIYGQLAGHAAYKSYDYYTGAGEGAGEEATRQTAGQRLTGIRITDSPLIRELSLELYGDAYLSIAVSAGNYENAISALMEFFRPS